MPMDIALRHALASVTKMLKTRPLLLAMNNSSIIFVLLRTDENVGRNNVCLMHARKGSKYVKVSGRIRSHRSRLSLRTTNRALK